MPKSFRWPPDDDMFCGSQHLSASDRCSCRKGEFLTSHRTDAQVTGKRVAHPGDRLNEGSMLMHANVAYTNIDMDVSARPVPESRL